MDNVNRLEELVRIEEKIHMCERSIDAQRDRMASMEAGAKNREDSECLHANLVASLNALKALRELVRKEVREAGA